MYVMFVHIQIKKDKIEDFKKIFQINIDGTRQEKGNIRFDLLQDATDPQKFLVYEVYESEQALEEHRKTEHYKKTVELLEQVMEGPRTKDFYHAVGI